jgi:hypothetical protein
MWMTSSIIGRLTSIAQADSDLLRADWMIRRSSSLADVSIKKLFSLPGSSQENGMRPKQMPPVANVRMSALSPESDDTRHVRYLCFRNDHS